MTIQLVFLGGISVGGFVFLTSSVGRFADPLQRIFQGLSRQYEHVLFAREIFVIFDTAPSIAMPLHPISVNASQPPEIVFEHVTFRYPNTDRNVLSDINLRIPPGSLFALVGINGAGKTTLVKLLARFYDPTEGRILINGVDLRDIDLVSWYGVLAVLFQHFPIYQGFTAIDGIALGDVAREKDRGKVALAAREAGADVFIKEWKYAYDQMVGKQFTDGVDPSRGQEQRLALARMFYRNAKCLILDEPTAAVDAESEVHIFHTIEAMKGETRILISHRFSTVRNANQICVLDNGIVRELGSYKDLMRARDEYARLLRLQAKGYEEDIPDVDA
jgi:ATP-binding cassette subfamily B protein